MTHRFWEIDTLRGFTVILMIFFHLMWDFSYFNVLDIDILTPGWQAFARTIATSFTLLLGVSLTLSYRRAKTRLDLAGLRRKYLQRAGLIFGLGLLITVATYFFIGANGYVIFGILHMLGAATFVGYLFLERNKWLTLLVGVGFIGVGIYLRGVLSQDPWWIWLGIKQYGRAMVDYYPVLPWTGVALVGVFAGYTLYPNGQRRFPLPDLSATLPIQGLRWLGRHSLLIYVLHQPILIGLLILSGFASL